MRRARGVYGPSMFRRSARTLLATALVAAACTAPPPAVVPSKSPPPAKLTVTAVGADGPLAGLNVCAVPLTGTQSCAPTARDGTATFSLARATYQIRSDMPQSQRRVGELVGADLTQGDASGRLQFERVRHIS